ncbi:predicted protein [Histoplasma mississippiense (nom. inval.)]|uniref:predicted protein n=1 Tax=Ajellomyces capsulatus (strain NAm1 / WU24) TaxID=2059318 RepID=UPI000157C85E|nr:predicted protein [Histoplasma mississippiense (nom. inval.)]EDN09611.1 predicted protein [Histoplasma mississippiense (nom. inval.)]
MSLDSSIANGGDRSPFPEAADLYTIHLTRPHMMKLNKVCPQNVVFHRELHRNDYAAVFLVSVQGFECVMKVHHDHPGHGRIHEREATAYQRLQAHGVTEKGYVPRFYGSIEKLEPELWQPNLNMFINDTELPSAIFIEYIPDMRQLHLDTFSKDRMARFVQAIKAITAALVMHNDLKARNFMVAPGERVVLLDFDRARTYDKNTITAEQQEWLREDVQIVQDLGRLLVGLIYLANVTIDIPDSLMDSRKWMWLRAA